ncbi:MAG: hypothetical protein F6K00_10370 [Leptolyngbya sp. SIOISBB]|nr:hypothetical protein [Leptolyngbya sp. SIOISBB]
MHRVAGLAWVQPWVKVATPHLSPGLPKSPYADQPESPVRGLTAQEVDDLLQGRGAGLARMAELNSYPGPRHVLDLREELALSPAQEQVIQGVFAEMQTQAQTLGKAIVEQEQAVSQVFATAAITPEQLHQQIQEIAQLYGELRAVHLQAHLEITPILSATQIARYDQLRGYADNASRVPHQHH